MNCNKFILYSATVQTGYSRAHKEIIVNTIQSFAHTHTLHIHSKATQYLPHVTTQMYLTLKNTIQCKIPDTMPDIIQSKYAITEEVIEYKELRIKEQESTGNTFIMKSKIYSYKNTFKFLKHVSFC